MNQPDNNGDSTMRFHWKQGINCYFDIDGITISVWASSWTGREEVRVDGQVVSALRSLRRRSNHEFSVNGVDYRVQVSLASFKTGLFEVFLYRNGVEVDSDQIRVANRDLVDDNGKIIWSKAWWKVGPVFALSGFAGAVCGYLVARAFT